jgi:hypothetical protein
MAKENPEAAQAFVAMQLDLMFQLQEENAEFIARRKGNRDMLKNFATQGLLSAEQLVEVEEVYPARERAVASVRVAALEEQLAKARERAQGGPSAEAAA